MIYVYIMADSERVTARVKWFNNKNGYGFASTLGENQRDVFVHHTSLSVGKEQYRYLVQGEYVDFQLMKSENGKHEYHATDITGVSDGPILCETRRVALASQSERNGSKGGNNRRPDSPTEAPSAEAA